MRRSRRRSTSIWVALEASDENLISSTGVMSGPTATVGMTFALGEGRNARNSRETPMKKRTKRELRQIQRDNRLREPAPAAEGQRRPIAQWAIGGLIALLVVGAGLLFARSTVAGGKFAGLQETQGPWQPEYANL